jgi:hypothetical protein
MIYAYFVAAISHVAMKSSHEGSKNTKNSTKSTFPLRETSCLGVFVAKKATWEITDFVARMFTTKSL